MDPNTLFTFANTLALFSWVILAIFAYTSWAPRLLLGTVIAGLSIMYAALVFQSLSMEDMSQFSTLAGVMSLFTSEWAVLTGWIHYLAFDLMVGLYIASDARTLHIPQLAIVPCLLFTFMLGPFGLLLYLLLRLGWTRKWFHYNL
jgi:hypothetical protein